MTFISEIEETNDAVEKISKLRKRIKDSFSRKYFHATVAFLSNSDYTVSVRHFVLVNNFLFVWCGFMRLVIDREI